MRVKKQVAIPSISDAAVEKATGRTWPQWFKILDKFPKDKTHTERARWLYDHHLKGGWWCQMVTVTYEQARGLRQQHETASGFQVSGSRTVPISVKKLYDWWTTKRSRWLPSQGVQVSSATPDKYLHLDWPDGTRVDVNFWPKGKSKSMVQIQQRKLKTAAAGKKMKAWWKARLDELANLVG